MGNTCDCGAPAKAKGMCNACYLRQWKANGGAKRPIPPWPERVWQKVDKTDDCWLWTGAKDGKGYGQVRRDGRLLLPHRIIYELERGTIPEGLELDHLCRNPSCVNPDHLEAVTHRENVLRGAGPTAINARKTHCHRGHEFTPDNIYSSSGNRHCKACTLGRVA